MWINESVGTGEERRGGEEEIAISFFTRLRSLLGAKGGIQRVTIVDM
jgi:hypothetical protein